jgi:hypothetical protein
MTVDRNYLIANFPAMSCRRPSLYDLAVMLWDVQQADRIINVDNWIDLIDLDLDGFGRSGFGVLLYFMEPEMLWAFLPGWLVLGLERRTGFENIVPVVVSILNPHQASQEEVDRSNSIVKFATPPQRLAISRAIIELADLHYRSHSDVQLEMAEVAEFWERLER